MQRKNLFLVMVTCFSSPLCFGQGAFTIEGTTTTVEQLAKENQAEFYEVEKRRYRLIERIARESYLKHFWQQRANKSKKSVAQEKRDYFKENVKISDADVENSMKRFKDHPQLSKLSEKERKKEIRGFLRDQRERSFLDGVVAAAFKDKKLRIDYPRPVEPTYEITIREDEPVRYGPENSDTSPIGCRGDDCVTIVEYSEFQCPFCARVLPAVREVLTKYKGKVRWVVRDFPLSFHNRAKPAAVAAKCALRQGKYWEMYAALFASQNALSDKDFSSYADRIKLDKSKWQACVDNPSDALAQIDANFRSGVKLGVTGTPAFFVNGRRLSGAIPFSGFQRVIEEELAKRKKS